MSGIFGFSRNFSENEKVLHALEVWNREYGNAAFDAKSDERHGIGAHIDHFSNNFPVCTPVICKDGGEAVCDALIYNRDELLSELCLSENEPVSDEELILRLILEKGFSALSTVNGDFAGAIYNADDGSWTLFRDHLGVRPLYYYADSVQFAFSTDIRGLIALPNADTSPDDGAIYCRMMGYNDLTLCGTDYKNIRCFPPASFAKISYGGNGFSMDVHIYWKLKQKKIKFKTEEEYISETRRIVTDAVKRRLDAVSGTVGAELSGGLDSGVIDILISRLGRAGKFYSWSWSAEDVPLNDGDDERRVIYDICKQENIECMFAPKKHPDNTEDTKEEKTEEIVPPFVNTLNLGEGAAWLNSQGARVVFTGHGGDEGISHRCPPFELLYNGELVPYLKFYYDTTKGTKLRTLRTLKRAIWQGVRDYSYARKPYHNTGLLSPNYLTDEFKERMKDKAVLQPLYFSYSPEKYVMQGGTRVRLDNVAYQGAKNGMRYMIPFADYRVMDYAVSIPRRMFLRCGESRYVYREAFRDIIPNSLYKVGYKDMASLRNQKIDAEIGVSLNEAAKRIAGELDRDFWSEYLNFDAIDKISLGENFTRGDYTRTSRLLYELNRCLLIQKARENAAMWCEEHE